MQRAMNETARRRQKQLDYNKEHNITPKSVSRIIDESANYKKLVEREEIPNKNIAILTKEMHQAAEELDFEKAAFLRDQIKILEGLTSH